MHQIPLDLFEPLEVQLDNVRRWNRDRAWGFTERDFAAIDQAGQPPGDGEVDVVSVYLPNLKTGWRKQTMGYLRTFDECWRLITRHHRYVWRWDNIASNTELLAMTSGSQKAWSDPKLYYERNPGVRRVRLSLLGKPGRRPAREEVLIAAAHFPKWVAAMDGEQVPFAGMYGYVCRSHSDLSWRNYPVLCRMSSSLPSHSQVTAVTLMARGRNQIAGYDVRNVTVL